MLVREKGELKPKEGTTQADPIAMGLHALGITPFRPAETGEGFARFLLKFILYELKEIVLK